jgi:hypothetical protein
MQDKKQGAGFPAAFFKGIGAGFNCKENHCIAAVFPPASLALL